jgi:membrane-bound metal-dependent hydrolase YbcI (DUF457 family)
MTFAPHLLLTTLGVQVFGLHGADMATAYAFGYGIDLIDHPIKLPLYLKKNGTNNEKHYHWRTPLQEPVALIWIVPLSIYFATWIPVVFFLSHVLLDYLVSYDKRPLYPFSMYTTRGFLLSQSDAAKEWTVTLTLAAINLVLGWPALQSLFS